MKKLLYTLSLTTLSITTPALSVACGPGDIVFKGKLSSSISNFNISFNEDDNLDEKFVLNKIFEFRLLNTPELQKGIYVNDLVFLDNEKTKATAEVIVTSECVKFEEETFKMNITFHKN